MKRALVLLWLVSGCAILADKADYRDYRSVRLAVDPEARAVAMHDYVQKHPSGHWHDSIQTERKNQELAAFDAGKDTRSGLQYYLRAYPDGTFVAQARSRLSAIGLIEQRRAQADREAAQLSAARKTRADELRRTWIGRFSNYWLKTLSELKGWGSPIPEVAAQNPQFSRAFGAQPRPRCTDSECIKYYTSPYAVPIPGGTRIERTLSLLLRLKMRAGKLERAELLLPERGFSRWYELENRKSIDDGSNEAREQAVSWAIERVLSGINELPGTLASATNPSLPAIDRPAVGPTGEEIDTSIEAPSDPQNRVSGEDNAGIGVAQDQHRAAPSVSDLVKPQAPVATPDMVIAPVAIDKQGQRVEQAKPPVKPTAADSGETMLLGPVAVPKAEGATTAAPESTAPAADGGGNKPAAGVKPQTRGFTIPGAGNQALRVTVFAAGSDGLGYDGIVIERTSIANKTKAAAKVAPTPAQPPLTH
jgi:hypothetical protein